MPLTLTATTANREKEGNVDIFLDLIKSTQCRRFIDVFAGSGSFSLFALQHGIAESYLINDAYPPIIYLFEAVRYHPETLILEYQNLCKKVSEKLKLFSMPQAYYLRLAEELADGNTKPFRKAVLWLFLANRLKQNRPLFFGEKIISGFDLHPTITTVDLVERIRNLNILFQKNKKLFFSAKDGYDFISAIEKLDNNDVVILDPPYPGYYSPKNSIFFRPEDDDVLFHKLLSILESLNKQKVKFILNYDLFFGKEKPFSKGYVINPEDFGLSHCILVSKNPNDAEFTILFEHIYISQFIKIDKLPKGLYPFKIFQELSYSDARDYIACRKTDPTLPLVSRL